MNIKLPEELIEKLESHRIIDEIHSTNSEIIRIYKEQVKHANKMLDNCINDVKEFFELEDNK